MGGARSEKSPDPLGKRALWMPPATGTGGDTPVEEIAADTPDPFSAGKRALYSGAPSSRESEHESEHEFPEASLARSGPFTVRCQRCRQVSHVGLLDLLIFQLPIGVWLPRGRFDRRMTCPSCRKRSWCSVTLRRG